MNSAGSSSAGGDLVSMPSNMAKLLECPICTEISTPPIFLCVKGHSVCDSCKRRITDCPLCKSPMTGGRNYALEDLINNSTFTCAYQSSGCLDVIKGVDMKDHLKNCPCRAPEVGQGDGMQQQETITVEDSESESSLISPRVRISDFSSSTEDEFEDRVRVVRRRLRLDSESDEEISGGIQEMAVVDSSSDFDTASEVAEFSSGEENIINAGFTPPGTGASSEDEEEQDQKSESDEESGSDEGDLNNSGMDTTESEEEHGPNPTSNEGSSSEDEEEQGPNPTSNEESSSEDEEEQAQNSGLDELSTEESSGNQSVLEIGSTEESEISDMSDFSVSSISAVSSISSVSSLSDEDSE